MRRNRSFFGISWWFMTIPLLAIALACAYAYTAISGSPEAPIVPDDADLPALEQELENIEYKITVLGEKLSRKRLEALVDERNRIAMRILALKEGETKGESSWGCVSETEYVLFMAKGERECR